MRSLPPIAVLADHILRRDRVALGRAITLIESTNPAHEPLAQELLQQLLAAPRPDSLRIAITGAPGVGKSTFVEALGIFLVERGHRVAVLAIDPSSKTSKGSILGDKTRMERLSVHERAFVRPSPSGESLGGVARKTREAIVLVEAAGYDVVLVETVGVGQSEVAAYDMTDLFVLLLLPGAGDELQGIKRGIVEMADIVAVNKADADRVKLANQARAHYHNALHLFPPKPSGWTPTVQLCSALEGTGIEALWGTVEAYRQTVVANGFFQENRRNQAEHWFRENLLDSLQAAFLRHPQLQQTWQNLHAEVRAGRITPFAAAKEAVKAFCGGA